MHRLWILGLLLGCPFGGGRGTPVAADSPEITEAFDRLYNFNFPAAHAILTDISPRTRRNRLPYAVRASAYLFY